MRPRREHETRRDQSETCGEPPHASYRRTPAPDAPSPMVGDHEIVTAPECALDGVPGMNRLVVGAAAVLAAALVPAATAVANGGKDPGQKLEARAILPADASFPAAANTDPAPAPGSVQP